MDLYVRRGPRSARLSTVRFELPRGLSVRAGSLRGNVVATTGDKRVHRRAITALSSRVVQVRGLGSRGADRVHLRLRDVSLSVSPSLRSRARRLEVSRLTKLSPLKLPAVVRTGLHDGRRARIGLRVTGRP